MSEQATASPDFQTAFVVAVDMDGRIVVDTKVGLSIMREATPDDVAHISRSLYESARDRALIETIVAAIRTSVAPKTPGEKVGEALAARKEQG